MIEVRLDVGALVGFREYLRSRGVDTENTPGLSFQRSRNGCNAVELPEGLEHHLPDFLVHKMERSRLN